jgi:hypothetical protein
VVTTEHPAIHTQLSAEQDHVPNQQQALQLREFAQQTTDHVVLQQIIMVQDLVTAVGMELGL